MLRKATGLLDCPVEILELISTYFCSHCTHIALWRYFEDGTANLLNLFSTCKQLCRATQPTLFHIFNSWYKPPEQSAVPFLRSLIGCSDLRNAVREVAYGHEWSPEDVLYIKTAISDLDVIQFLHQWKHGDSADKLLGLLLSVTPGVTAIRSTTLPALPASSHTHAPTLPKLRELQLEGTSDLKELIQLLPQVPNLETLLVYHLNSSLSLDAVGSLFQGSKRPCLGNLRRLDLTISTVLPTVLSRLISGCGPLETFYFRFGTDGGRNVFGNEVSSPFTPWLALLKKRQSLRSLTFFVEEAHHHVPPPGTDPCFLRNFEYLEELELDREASLLLLGYWQEHGKREPEKFLTEVLPSSIKHLTLRDAPSALIGAVRGLGYVMRTGLFPSLKKLKIMAQWGLIWVEKEDWMNHWEDLTSAFRGTDTTLTFYESVDVRE